MQLVCFVCYGVVIYCVDQMVDQVCCYVFVVKDWEGVGWWFFCVVVCYGVFVGKLVDVFCIGYVGVMYVIFVCLVVFYFGVCVGDCYGRQVVGVVGIVC